MANDKHDESDGEGASRLVGDALKKLLTAGVSAAFMTEEGIRSFLGGVNLPKDTVNVLLAGASKSKEELMNRVGKEIIGIVSKIDFVKEASRFVEEHKFRVNAEIEVIRKEKTPDKTSDKTPDKA
jgi:hypothetical protein